MLHFCTVTVSSTGVYTSFKEILATLKSSKTKALTKAYAMILDNLDDAHDLTFVMIQQACVRKLRRRQARGADRSQERRPATPRRAYKDIQRHKDFTRSKPEDVSAFLVNFLEQRGVKPKKVLKANNLPPDDLHDAFALHAWYQAASPYLP